MTALWRPAYVAIGSNLDRPRERVLQACELIGALPGMRLEARSRLYSTRPLGPQNQPDFVNAAVGARSAGDRASSISTSCGWRARRCRSPD
jgi:2-amino-4-hydroxy-6-hydroxymethyldihydropteridine diphosphokinase